MAGNININKTEVILSHILLHNLHLPVVLLDGREGREELTNDLHSGGDTGARHYL